MNDNCVVRPVKGSVHLALFELLYVRISMALDPYIQQGDMAIS